MYQLGLGGLKTDQSHATISWSFYKLICKIEDVLIKDGEFKFPVDFIVLETQPVNNLTRQISLILGQSFLDNSNALINCFQ